MALELELDAPALALLVVLLELLPHALTARARTPTAASVLDHALTFILSSAFAPVAAPPVDGPHHRRGQATGVDI